MVVMSFLKYLLTLPVLTSRGPQFMVYGIAYWIFPVTYGFQVFVALFVSALVAEYGRFIAADGPQDPALTAQEFIDTQVPAVVYYLLISIACAVLVLYYFVPQYMHIWNMFVYAGGTLASYYSGTYIGMKYGLRIF